MNEVGEVVCEVYAAGAKLVVLDVGIGVEGEIPAELKDKVRGCRAQLLEALDGDPLAGPGWEARSALYRRALQWLDGEIGQMGLSGTLPEGAATDAMCRQGVEDRLNAAWCDGSFDEFRAALREYVRADLHAAKGKGRGSETGRNNLGDSKYRVGQGIGRGSRVERSRT